MASSSQIRSWWSAYECATSKMVRVAFPGPSGPTQWSLLVADRSAPIWVAVAQIMVSEPYLFRESAGGTYNCRPPSLHSYGLALDLNPSKNPFDCPMKTDMPASFIERMEGIRANGKQAIQWGGRWPCENPPDPMHFQINVAPADCTNVVWDTGDNDGGDEMTLKKGDAGNAVNFFQNALNAWKPALNLVVGSSFGTAMESAVKNYQGASDLPQTGEIDGITGVLLAEYRIDKVDPPPSGSTGLKRGDTVTLT